MADTILKMLPGANGDDYISQFKSATTSAGKTAAALSGGLTGLTGALSLFGNAAEWSKGTDITGYQNQIDDIRAQRPQRMYDLNSILQASENLPTGFSVSADDLNPTSGQSAMQIGGSALSGAMTGLQVGGLWGGLAGLLIGGGAAGFADARKRKENALNANILTMDQETELGRNQLAYTNGVDEAQKIQFGKLYGHKRSFGGLLKPYAGKRSELKIIHSHCGGGTLVRIKSK